MAAPSSVNNPLQSVRVITRSFKQRVPIRERLPGNDPALVAEKHVSLIVAIVGARIEVALDFDDFRLPTYCAPPSQQHHSEIEPNA
jgi:hypothetical protein